MCPQTRNSLAKAFDNLSRSKNLKPKKSGGINLAAPPPLKASRVKCNTRFESRSTYYINAARTSYGQFNVCVAAAADWNDLDKNLKQLLLKSLKTKV